jgi:hypothetical protein
MHEPDFSPPHSDVGGRVQVSGAVQDGIPTIDSAATPIQAARPIRTESRPLECPEARRR